VIFNAGPIEGLWIIDLEPIRDHRGFFARSWCAKEFADHGLEADWTQSNLQFSPSAGTMRGLHYQRPPYEEIKLVRCTRGAAFDVAADLRPDSPTYLQWFGVELRAENHTTVWVPKGCAHGWLSLEAETEVFYMTSTGYTPEAVGEIRFDDPLFGFEWPRPVELTPPGHDTWRFYSEEHEIRMGDRSR
jgi:dTDP-4-dehydrorhamnose 3,5-epimerase